MAHTQTILTSEEMSELQELVDEMIIHNRNPILPLKCKISFNGEKVENILRIAEILGLEVGDE